MFIYVITLCPGEKCVNGARFAGFKLFFVSAKRAAASIVVPLGVIARLIKWHAVLLLVLWIAQTCQEL